MAALAMLMVGLLPSVHVHQQENDTVIHSHLIDDESAHHDENAAHDETNLDHDGHLTARILPLTYNAGAPFSLRCSPAVTILAAGETASAIVRPANRATILPTHDPPLRFICSPAPPASA